MATTDPLVSTASAKIGSFGSAFYFVPETGAVGKDHGLDAFRFYFMGRGGVLGDVESAVIRSAFGYFHPALVEKMWTTARERSDLSPRECGTLYFDCSAEFGRRHFANVPGLQAFVAAAEKVHAAATPVGFPLYAGISAEALATDLPARAMQLMTVLREYKGGAHLLAVLAVGLDPTIAHGIRRPDFWAAFGYPADNVPTGTEQERSLLADADALTARMITPAYSTLTPSEADDLLTGLAEIDAAMPENASIGR